MLRKGILLWYACMLQSFIGKTYSAYMSTMCGGWKDTLLQTKTIYYNGRNMATHNKYVYQKHRRIYRGNSIHIYLLCTFLAVIPLGAPLFLLKNVERFAPDSSCKFQFKDTFVPLRQMLCPSHNSEHENVSKHPLFKFSHINEWKYPEPPTDFKLCVKVISMFLFIGLVRRQP